MSKFNAVRQNIEALKPDSATNRHLRNILKCCWKCQQSKRTLGGKLVMKPGLFMFICKECVEAKKAKDDEHQTNP